MGLVVSLRETAHCMVGARASSEDQSRKSGGAGAGALCPCASAGVWFACFAAVTALVFWARSAFCGVMALGEEAAGGRSRGVAVTSGCL